MRYNGLMMNNPHQPEEIFTTSPFKNAKTRTVIWTTRPIEPVTCFIEQLDRDGNVTESTTATLDPQHLAAHALHAPHIASVIITYDESVDAGATRFTRVTS